MTVDAAIAQVVFGFDVDETTARRLIGQAVEAVEAGEEVTKAMRPFGGKAAPWRPAGTPLTADALMAGFDAEGLADDAMADWAAWLDGTADAEFATLLDVEPADTGRGDGKAARLATKDRARAYDWQWDVKRQRYRYPNTSRLVSNERVKGLRERRIEESKMRMRAAAKALADGTLDVKGFQRAVRDESAKAHLQARLLAVGGRENMTRADYQWVHDRVKREAGYLARFGQDLRAGRHSPTGAESRAAKYAGASIRAAYYSGATDRHIAAGYKQKARLGPDDERTCDPCRKEIMAGYVPIGKDGWVVGDTDCQSEDRCEVVFK